MLQKNTVTIVFILMFFVLIYYVYSTRKDAAEAAKKAAEEKAKANSSSASLPPQPPIAQAGNYIPPPQPKPTGGGSPPPVTNAIDKTKQLNLGSKGASVKALQELLNNLGYKDSAGNTLATDGSYGPKTKYAHESAMKAVPTTDRSINALSNLGGFNWVDVALAGATGGMVTNNDYVSNQFYDWWNSFTSGWGDTGTY